MQPEPLPGTHLAEVDCVDCWRPVLAIPERVDMARCTGCGHEHYGTGGYQAPARPRAAASRPRARHVSPVAQPQDLPWTASCPHCEWTWKMPSAEHLALVVSNHIKITHDPKGWASGVRGGLRGRRRY
jgi:hypothetical protein